MGRPGPDGESVRRDAFWIVFLGAEEDLWGAQFIRHDLECREGGTGGNDFHGPAVCHGGLHGKFVVIVQGPSATSQTDLLEIVSAVDFLSHRAVLSSHAWQDDGRQN